MPKIRLWVHLRKKAEVVGRGQRSTERHVKDTISVPMCPQGAKKSHLLHLVSISYGFHTSWTDCGVAVWLAGIKSSADVTTRMDAGFWLEQTLFQTLET